MPKTLRVELGKELQNKISNEMRLSLLGGHEPFRDHRFVVMKWFMTTIEIVFMIVRFDFFSSDTFKKNIRLSPINCQLIPSKHQVETLIISHCHFIFCNRRAWVIGYFQIQKIKLD